MHASWYPTSEAAKLIGIASSTLNVHLRSGVIPAIKDEHLDCYFVHKNVLSYLLDIYYSRRRFTTVQKEILNQLHNEALTNPLEKPLKDLLHCLSNRAKEVTFECADDAYDLSDYLEAAYKALGTTDEGIK